MSRPLGMTQKAVLAALESRGYWDSFSGWHWDGKASTRRILESLYKRDLVTRYRRPYGGFANGVVGYAIPGRVPRGATVF